MSNEAISEIVADTSTLESGDVALVTKAISSIIMTINLTDETVSCIWKIYRVHLASSVLVYPLQARDMLFDNIDSVLSVDEDVLAMASETTDTSNS